MNSVTIYNKTPNYAWVTIYGSAGNQLSATCVPPNNSTTLTQSNFTRNYLAERDKVRGEVKPLGNTDCSNLNNIYDTEAKFFMVDGDENYFSLNQGDGNFYWDVKNS
ncbi:hypothetical protein HH214_00360 [Mucilaginibacter robiniae]|uniref:Uncharacterized protein n=1 Tax=Mucilaginibacter robiniae TaxID=2728022 RepID=A0A7L5DWR7_9SPHI|nr:hypothetical protein [Mucilaginibacter robiniae]QJD94429.1 hypothetical protein HH214_00360 [Mucilaginibacter robiniae]